jgi:hypothetical protein
MKEPKKKKSNAGRKKVVIDWKRVDKSLMSGSNGVQVSAMLGVHPDTLYNKCKEVKKMDFSAYQQQKRQEGNDVLLGLQYELAKSGDRGMLIWLGKNRLDQSDKKEIKQHNTGSLININMTGGTEKPIRSENDIKE